MFNRFCVEPLERRRLLSATPDTLYSFTGGTDGNEPSGISVDSTGDVFGTTYLGGNNGEGAIYKLAQGATDVSTVYSFAGGTDGSTPAGIFRDSAGNLYGTAFSGGAHNDGTIWEFPVGATTVTVLYAFTGGASGSEPTGITRDSSGDLFGNTDAGGTHNDGTIWELPAGGTTVTILYSFPGSAGSAEPDGIAINAAGDLYGTNFVGNTVWELAGGSTSLTTIYTFPVGGGGAYPEGIAIDSSGDLFGSTGAAGANLVGNVWEMASGATKPTTLYSFTDGSDGEDPSTITLDNSGNLYGATYEGGDNGGGTVFEMTGVVPLPQLALTTPATAASVNEGDSYTISWTGGSPGDTVQLWAEGGPTNSWTELTAGVPDSDGSFSWNTTGVDHGWYNFQAWDIPVSGTAYAVQSPNYLHVVNPSATAPTVSLTNPVLAGESVQQGNSYTLNFTAADGAGDTNPIYVQLWVYSGNTGQWTELPSANYLPASQGSYVLDTTGMAPGWYSFAAHATNGDQWSYASSPGWLNITVATPTISFTTPTTGQSVAAGGTFNLDWNITGLSTTDLANSTVQIWAQYLNNGTPVWTEIAASVSASGGAYTWTVPTAPGGGTYYAFSIWLNDGNMWWTQASPNWLQVT